MHTGLFKVFVTCSPLFSLFNSKVLHKTKDLLERVLPIQLLFDSVLSAALISLKKIKPSESRALTTSVLREEWASFGDLLLLLLAVKVRLDRSYPLPKDSGLRQCDAVS